MKEKYKKLTRIFFLESAGKKTLNLTRVSIVGASTSLLFFTLSAILSRKEDHTFYVQSSDDRGPIVDQPIERSSTNREMQNLFASGSQKLEREQQRAENSKHKAGSIKYFAPQIVGSRSNGLKSIKSGAKLLGFLLTSIDTREPSIVRVVLPHGGTSDTGFEIEKNSIITGSYTYRGDGSKVSLLFSRLDAPDGDSQKISATALDASDYTTGIQGTVYSDDGVKVVSSLGLSMAASMTDVLTEREVLGNSAGPAESKPTMRNALLQGLSRVTEAEAGRVSEGINDTKDYVVVPKGKEIIIQLTEDLRHE